jgi:hypothetical protein
MHVNFISTPCLLWNEKANKTKQLYFRPIEADVDGYFPLFSQTNPYYLLM